jgi:hypothetical protein
VFSTHINTLAQRERIPQVLHSFDAIESRLSVGISSAFHTTQNGNPCPFGENLGEGIGLVEPAFSQSGRVKRHRNQTMRWIFPYACVLHGFDQKLGEHPPQIKLTPILKAMDQLSQYTFCLVVGHGAIKGRCMVFTIRAEEFSNNHALERSGASSTKGRSDTRRRLPASFAKEVPTILRVSTPNTIGGVEQLKQCIKQSPNRISHANRLPKLKTRVRAGPRRTRARR